MLRKVCVLSFAEEHRIYVGDFKYQISAMALVATQMNKIYPHMELRAEWLVELPRLSSRNPSLERNTQINITFHMVKLALAE